ncbi:PREDICTED: prothymosin alpha, partial [Chinchilla lanigera]|uniref:prothymosin alpha n=1 Tax=Chinchilla lanigera TaxID=34839 RepID=UPI000698DDD2
GLRPDAAGVDGRLRAAPREAGKVTAPRPLGRWRRAVRSRPRPWRGRREPAQGPGRRGSRPALRRVCLRRGRGSRGRGGAGAGGRATALPRRLRPAPNRAPLPSKDLKEKKEVVEEAENGRDAPANGNANEENGEQEADNEVDEEEEEGGEEEEEEEEGDGEEEDGDEDEEAEAATGKRAAEDDEDDDVDTKKQKTDEDD